VENIHKTAIVDPKAELGKNVEISPFAIIEEDAVIGNGSWIGPNVFIANGTRIGKNCKVYQGAVLGTVPQDLKFEGEKTTLEIGDETVIREYCTLNRGTKDRLKTEVGTNCLLMAYVHVAHDCHLGNNVILANAINMAGHVTMEDFVGIGGMTPIHQFVRIGQHAYIGGGYRIPKDVPPFILAGREPLQFAGINSIGLKRRGFSSEQIQKIQRVYKIIYRNKLNVTQAITRIKEEYELEGEVKQIVDFYESSERGVL
jgi:UDP-N-acetylglucosamine acyltransferase